MVKVKVFFIDVENIPSITFNLKKYDDKLGKYEYNWKVREDLFSPLDLSAIKSARKVVTANKGLVGVEKEFNTCEIILHNDFYDEMDKYMDVYCIRSLILKGIR